jgi:hypothetical protein
VSDPEDKKDIQRDAALNALIEAINNTGGLVLLDAEESKASYGALYGCKFDREATDLAAAYLLACEATNIMPMVEGKVGRKFPIARVDIILTRECREESNDDDTDCVHFLAQSFPEDVREVRVLDCDGAFLYYADQREGS